MTTRNSKQSVKRWRSFYCEPRLGQSLIYTAGTKRYDLRWREPLYFRRYTWSTKNIFLGPQGRFERTALISQLFTGYISPFIFSILFPLMTSYLLYFINIINWNESHYLIINNQNVNSAFRYVRIYSVNYSSDQSPFISKFSPDRWSPAPSYYARSSLSFEPSSLLVRTLSLSLFLSPRNLRPAP